MQRMGKRNGQMNHDIEIREYVPEDLDQMVEIWNEVVEEGIAFPQEEWIRRREKYFLTARVTAV